MAKSKNALNSKKEIRFDLFRYQLLPTSQRQTKLFDEYISLDELKQRKNALFKEALLEVKAFYNSSGEPLEHRINYDKGEITVIQLGVQKNVMLVDKDFKGKVIPSYPNVYLIFHNDPEVQKIAISTDYSAFSNSFVVIHIIENALNKVLEKYNIEMAIAPILNEEDFWELVGKYENRITVLKFEIIRPNISNISSSFGEDFKNLANDTNSFKTELKLQAPEKKTLENINRANEALAQIADYGIKGGGSDISIKVKGVRRYIKTDSAIERVNIDEAELSGPADKVIEAYQKILKN